MALKNIRKTFDLDPRVELLQYHLLRNGFVSEPETRSLHNQAFVYWLQFWQQEFQKIDPSYTIKKDDFYRQTRIAVLTYEKEIVGMHLYQLFDLRLVAAMEHSYMKGSFNQEYLNALAVAKFDRVMSMEYLTINEQWRSKSIGVPLAYVLAELGVKVADMLGAQVSIAPARTDLKVDKICEDIGGSVLVRAVEFHNVLCDLIAVPTGAFRPSSKKYVHQIAEHLWDDWQNRDREYLIYPEEGLSKAG